MSYTQTEICNLALTRIGADRIVDIAETSDRNARFCALFYEPALEELLRTRPWSFAIKRVNLTRSTETPAFGWTYQFRLPQDCIHLLECNGQDPWAQQEEEFAIESGHVLTNAETAQVRYVFRNTNPSEYPADFVEALVVSLASRLATPITGSTSLSRALREEMEALHLPRASSQSGNESRRRRTNRLLESDLVKARYRS